jgi:hypothetical protein
MCIQDLLVCLELFLDNLKAKTPAECFSKSPCNCPHPGKEPQCEDCEHLEACLSRFHPSESQNAYKTLNYN